MVETIGRGAMLLERNAVTQPRNLSVFGFDPPNDMP